MRFCFEYSIVEEALVEDTAIRLVLATCAGVNPMIVRAGVIRMPPPTPVIDPIVPAPMPIMIKIRLTSNNDQHISLVQ